MELVAGFTLTCLGLEQCFGFLFNLFLGHESLIPVRPPLPKASSIFSFTFLCLLPPVRSGLVSPEPTELRVCQHPVSCWRDWDTSTGGFRGIFHPLPEQILPTLTAVGLTDTAKVWGQIPVGDKSESASARLCWGLWCRRRCHSSARRKGPSPGGTWRARPGAELSPAVPRDPRQPLPGERRVSPTPTPQRFIPCNKTSPVERGHPAAGLFPAGSGCRRV